MLLTQKPINGEKKLILAFGEHQQDWQALILKFSMKWMK
jgi:hypothetical protein